MTHRISTGNVPAQVLDTILTIRLSAKLKPSGKIRPLGTPTILRKIVARAWIEQAREETTTYLSPLQESQDAHRFVQVHVESFQVAESV